MAMEEFLNITEVISGLHLWTGYGQTIEIGVLRTYVANFELA